MFINKRFYCLLVFIMILILFAAQGLGFASANAGQPVFMPEGGAGGFIFDNNDYIRINHEELDFTITDANYGGFNAQVSAVYSMENTAPDAESVQMLFPYYTTFIGNEDFLDAIGSISVQAGGESIPYSLRMLGGSEYTYERDTNKFIQKVNSVITGLQDPLDIKFDTDAEYDIYYFEPETGADTVTIEYDYSPGGFVFINGSERSFSRVDDKITMELWQFNASQPIFAICGADSSGITAVRGSVARKEQIADIKAFFIDYVASLFNADEGLIQLSPLFYEDVFSIAFSRDFDTQPFFTSYSLTNIFEFAILGICYQVEFAGHEVKDVSVSYEFSPYKLNEKGVYTHTYIYFLSPAGHWKDFKNLNISVDVSQTRYKYMLQSSVEFDFDEDTQVYSFASSRLPDGELTFKMFYNEKLPAINPSNVLFGAIVAVVCIPIIAIIILIVVLVRRRQQKNAKKAM